LNFDKSASIYKEEEKLEGLGQGGGMRWMSSMTGGGGTFIKCKKNCMLLIKFMGKEFLVKDSLVNISDGKWRAKLELLVGTIVLRRRP
jgi:hypothetical protein